MHSKHVEGKTKIIIPTNDPHVVMMETKDGLTAGDAAKKAQIAGIGVEKTKQAACVFSHLQKCGLPTAFRKQANTRTLECDACEMLPLEVVVRRYPWGSYFKRNPNAAFEDGAFDVPVVEFFHKHAVVRTNGQANYVQMREDEARDMYMRNGKWTIEVHTDPLCLMHGNSWQLVPAKEPLGSSVLMDIAPVLDDAERTKLVEGIVLPAFYALESLWASIMLDGSPVTLADVKMEIGYRLADGKLVIADVIDNDSWRLWPAANPEKQLDKQIFRDGGNLDQVYDSYKKVTKLLAAAV